jgi:hypothetical protein
MNKIFYTLGFLLIFSLFNNNAKAQSVADVDPCTKENGAVNITTQKSSGTDQTCDTSGATNLTLNIYSLGFCTSAPTVRFASAGALAKDERDAHISALYTDGTSDFSSCTWTIKQSTTSVESLDSVGDIEPLPNDEIPPPGTYTHAVLVISNSMSVTGSATFTENIRDTIGASGTTDQTKNVGNLGTKCWTNGSVLVDTGKQGMMIGTSPEDASTKKTAGSYQGGATCGETPSPTANTIVSYYSNHEGANVGGASCTTDPDYVSPGVDGPLIAGCNTTRSEETTAFGTLTVLFTTADLASLATNSPIIRRSEIVTTGNGINTGTNTLTGVFAYNTPMVVTSNTTGMEIFINMSNALSLDFEPSGLNNSVGGGITNSSSTSPPRIRSIGSGPFGIQFRAVEGGGIN